MQRNTDTSIGERIARRRRLLGLSVRQVAERAGLAPSTLSRIERGLRGADNRFILASLAEALRWPVSDLTGQPPIPTDRATAEASAGVHETIRAAVEADLGYEPHDSVPEMRGLEQESGLVADLRLRCDYAGALQRLPELIRRLYAAAFGHDRIEALRYLVIAHYDAAAVIRYSGDPAGACLASERAQQAAEILDDPVLLGLAAFSRATSASGCGLYERGARIADRAAAELDRSTNCPDALEVLGMLHLTVAFCQFARGDVGGATDRLAATDELADRTGQSTALRLNFGPENNRLWRISMEADGGDPGHAVEVARATRPDLVPSTSRQAAYFLDTGRALARIYRDQEAVRMLMSAERIAPQRVRTSPLAAETVRVLLERSRRNAAGTELRGLCGRMKIAT